MNVRGILGILPPRLRYARDVLPAEVLDLPRRVVLLVPGGGDLPVSKGSRVKSGQRIFGSGPGSVFSTVTGEVSGVSALSWLDGEEYRAVEITREGDDAWEPLFEGTADITVLGRDEALSRLADAGYDLSGLSAGGLGAVVVNCFEGDLLVSGAGSELASRADEAAAGIGLMRLVSGCGRVIAAVPRGSGGAIPGAESVSVKGSYPVGMEELLLRRLGLRDEKAAVVGIEELIGMVTSLRTGRPRYERVVTLVREGNVPVKNIRVRIGTPVSELFEREGIRTGEGYKVVLGGPMRGRSVYHNDFPVTADTTGVLVQGPGDVTEVSNAACLNCGRCVRVCPQRLQVNLLCRYAEYALFERCRDFEIDACIECGMCAYVCTSRRPLVQLVQFAKAELLKLDERDEEGGDVPE